MSACVQCYVQQNALNKNTHQWKEQNGYVAEIMYLVWILGPGETAQFLFIWSQFSITITDNVLWVFIFKPTKWDYYKIKPKCRRSSLF
jgi:hypothetical protein